MDFLLRLSDWPHGHAITITPDRDENGRPLYRPHEKVTRPMDNRGHQPKKQSPAQYHRRKPAEKRLAQMSAASRRRNRGVR